MRSSRPPHYVRLLIGSARYSAMEFSAAGLSLAPSVAERAGLDDLQRGDEREVTLCIGGTGWEEVYDVVLRLVGRGPAQPVESGQAAVEFAFVMLPPSARRLLGQASVREDDTESGSDACSGASGERRLAPFAFARLLEKDEPSHRLALSVSEAVLALTRRRNSENGPHPNPTAPPVPVAVLHLGTGTARDRDSLPAGTLLVYGVALFAVLVVFLGVLFG